MAQHGGFFNALLKSGVYDREYNADDYSNNLAVVISDGVLRSNNDDLKAIADGMNVTIGIGRGWIRGRWYLNDTPYNFVVPAASTVYPRKDRICLRLDNKLSERTISLYYTEGVPAEIPIAPAPVDTEDVKDLVICEIDVPANATAVTITDTRADASLCGWVYSVSGDGSFFASLDSAFGEWFTEKKESLSTVTIFKQYVWQGVTETSEQDVITFDIPQYDATGVDIIQVYTNGLLEVEGTDYTLDGSNINFVNGKAAGQEITVICYKSIDGEGLGTMSDRLESLENTVAKLNDYTDYNYICTGNADNVKLSNIVQEFLNGGTDYQRMTIRVYGTLGVSNAYAGAGDLVEPYLWFKFGTNSATSRRVIIDFENCNRIEFTVPQGTSNVVFSGYNIHVKNANCLINANFANTAVVGFDCKGRTLIEDCAMLINGSNGSYIAKDGTFNRCNFNVRNYSGASACFRPDNNSLLRITDCECFAYAMNGATGMVVYVDATMSTACVVVNGMACPSFAVTGLAQSHAVLDNSNNGFCAYNNLITPLTISATGQSVTGTLKVNKYNKV